MKKSADIKAFLTAFGRRAVAAVAILSLLGNAVQYLHYSTGRPLVTVGSRVITKKQYLDQLEYQAGPAVLKGLVSDALIAQAAARSGVTPTAQDIDARLAAIERRTPQLLAPYRQDEAKMARLRQDIGTSLALENLRIQDVVLTRAEVAAYYRRHPADFALPQQVQTTVVVARNAIDGATAVRLLQEGLPPDAIARHPRLKVAGVGGYRPDLSVLPPVPARQLADFPRRAGAGEARLFGGAGLYAAVQVTRTDPARVPPLAQVADQAERLARLERAPTPQEEIARLYHAAPPTVHSGKYAGYLAVPAESPSAGEGRQTASVP